MAETVNVNDLATLSPSALDGDYYGIVFDANGDTNKVVFNDAVAQANENNGSLKIKSASVTIPSAQVLTLNSSPVTIVSGVSGKILVLVSAIFRATYNSATYATNTDIELRHTGSSSELTTAVAKLGFTANSINQWSIKADPAADQLISGANIEAFVQTGNPTTGDSDITIDVKYYEMDV